MRVIENKSAPIIITDVNGRILKLNSSAVNEIRGIELGTDVFDIIDADAIRKLSMYSDKIDLVETKLEKFKLAFIKVRGKGVSKTVEISLGDFESSVADKLEETRRIVGLYSESSFSKATTCVDALRILSCICDKISERKELTSNRIILRKGEGFFAKLGNNKAELLFISTIFLLMELSFTSDIFIELSENGEIEFKITTKDLYIVRSIDELSLIYPQIKPKLVLIESICEDENIELDVSKFSKELILTYKLPIGNKGEMFVKITTDTLDERISTFIDTFHNA